MTTSKEIIESTLGSTEKLHNFLIGIQHTDMHDYEKDVIKELIIRRIVELKEIEQEEKDYHEAMEAYYEEEERQRERELEDELAMQEDARLLALRGWI